MLASHIIFALYHSVPPPARMSSRPARASAA
jgi:hypothetical protein